MDFTVSDQHSETWRKLKEHLQQQKATLQATAGVHLDAEKRAEVVGRIRVIDEMLGLELAFIERTSRLNDGVHL